MGIMIVDNLWIKKPNKKLKKVDEKCWRSNIDSVILYESAGNTTDNKWTLKTK